MLHEQEGGDIALIPHAYDGDRDPELAVIPLASKGMRVPAGPVLSNAFGFGGNNCSLVLAGAPR
jgi:3-oxoacyl-[acyl-carrier-protein] synthase I